MDEINEEWKDVVGYEGFYQVSNLGRVKSMDRVIKRRKYGQFKKYGVILVLNVGYRGYVDTKLHKNGVKMGKLVHRLVAEAFIPNPENKPVVNHKNGDKEDNRLCNLEWATYSENSQHAIDTGLTPIPKGVASGKTTLTNEKVLAICSELDKYERSQKSIAEEYGVSVGCIGDIHTGARWNWLTNRKGNITSNLNNLGGNNHWATKVVNCRGEVFNSMAEAATFYGIKSTSTISASCRGKRKYAGKYKDSEEYIKWNYVD